jgi:hypothetical protein
MLLPWADFGDAQKIATDSRALQCDFRQSRKTKLRSSGFVPIMLHETTVHGALYQARDAKILASVKEWAAAHEVDGVVWTDLASNFQEKTGRPFSITAARDHLLGPTDSGKAQARLYFRQAPNWVKTPLRTSAADIIG